MVCNARNAWHGCANAYGWSGQAGLPLLCHAYATPCTQVNAADGVTCADWSAANNDISNRCPCRMSSSGSSGGGSGRRSMLHGAAAN